MFSHVVSFQTRSQGSSSPWATETASQGQGFQVQYPRGTVAPGFAGFDFSGTGFTGTGFPLAGLSGAGFLGENGLSSGFFGSNRSISLHEQSLVFFISFFLSSYGLWLAT